MFKIAKYYFLLHWFQGAKRNLIAIMVLIVLFVMAIFVFNDLISMFETKTMLVLAKWIVLLFLLAVMVFNVKQVFTAVSVPFVKKDLDKKIDVKLEKILDKKHLLGRSERIFNKYRDTK